MQPRHVRQRLEEPDAMGRLAASPGRPLPQLRRTRLRSRKLLLLVPIAVLLCVAFMVFIASTLSHPPTSDGTISLAQPTFPPPTVLPNQISVPPENSTIIIGGAGRGTPEEASPPPPPPPPPSSLAASPSPTPLPTAKPQKPYINEIEPNDPRTARPEPVFDSIFEQYEEGEYQPEEPERLPGLRVIRQRYTPQELLDKYQNMSFVYSFVNGSDPTHYYRKRMILDCKGAITTAETAFYNSPVYDDENDDQPVAQTNGAALQKQFLKCSEKIFGPADPKKTIQELLEAIRVRATPDNRDRETDELRHSMRSIEQHIRWHRGRVVIVSPGHHPQWVDAATNFLSSSCGGAPAAAAREDGAHVRVTTVHQDAVMPYGLKLTVDSHSVEQHLWRVKNITSVHVYFNDDYFVNRDVAITDFFNEYGGTIVRTEKGILRDGIRAKKDGGTWGDGVRNSHLFTLLHLDALHEDHLPLPSLVQSWAEDGRLTDVNGNVSIAPPSLSAIIDTARHVKAQQMPNRLHPRRHRRYTTHAPFTYCTNMFRFLKTAYEVEFAQNSIQHRSRSARGLFLPFLYNAFVMARPWQASPKFLPYLLDLNASRYESRQPQPVEIYLNNDDGCGPSSLRGGYIASECVYAKFLDNITHNAAVIKRVNEEVPLYFNINAGFKSEEASLQLVKFLSTKFAKPVYVERGASEELRALYDALMGLPVVVLTSFSEGVCPAVRSLQLWLPEHRGSVVGIVQRFGDDSDPALSELRQTLKHRVRSAMPAVACALDSARVRVVEWERERTVADVLSAAGPSAAIPLPASCGVGGSADGSVSVRAIVVDARTASGGVELDARWLRGAVTVPGQTVALEDFDVVRMADGAAVLVLSRAAADAKGVHWIDGASESDLLLTFPLPYPPYEDMLAPVEFL